jgi:hypothetical protein
VLRSYLTRREDERRREEPALVTRFDTERHMMWLSEFRSRLEVVGGCTLCDPLLDDDVVELAMSIPNELLYHGHRGRGLFRHAFRGLVPDEVRLRKDKLDPGEGLEDILRAAGGEQALDVLLSMRALQERGLVEPAAFRRDFAARLAKGGGEWANLWFMLALEALALGMKGESPLRAAGGTSP